ncbi:MAG: acyl-CoA dehydrogenase family protein [Bacteroidota bacterium]
MDFSWPEEYLNYREQVVKFAQEELNEAVVARDREGRFPEQLWKRCAAFGIQGLAAPKQYGGQLEEINFIRAMLAMEGLGYGCIDNGLAFGLNAQMWTVQMPFVHFGNEAQKEKFLHPMATGQMIGAHALTEPDAGSDVYSMQSRAEKVDGGYLLNGTKHLITFSPIADFILVFANLNPKLGKWGISAFIVEKDRPGFTASPVWEKMGMRTIPFGAVELKDCFVPEANRLGKEGVGFSIMNHTLEYDRCCILASQLGTMERQLEKAVEFAKNRKQYGQAISQFQSVSNRIVEMKLRLETARLLLYKVAWLKHQGKSAIMEAAMLKLHLSESFVHSSLDAIRTQGGQAYLTENQVERDLRDAIGGILYAGTSDIQKNIIARLMGL